MEIIYNINENQFEQQQIEAFWQEFIKQLDDKCPSQLLQMVLKFSKYYCEKFLKKELAQVMREETSTRKPMPQIADILKNALGFYFLGFSSKKLKKSIPEAVQSAVSIFSDLKEQEFVPTFKSILKTSEAALRKEADNYFTQKVLLEIQSGVAREADWCLPFSIDELHTFAKSPKGKVYWTSTFIPSEVTAQAGVFGTNSTFLSALRQLSNLGGESAFSKMAHIFDFKKMAGVLPPYVESARKLRSHPYHLANPLSRRLTIVPGHDGDLRTVKYFPRLNSSPREKPLDDAALELLISASTVSPEPLQTPPISSDSRPRSAKLEPAPLLAYTLLFSSIEASLTSNNLPPPLTNNSVKVEHLPKDAILKWFTDTVETLDPQSPLRKIFHKLPTADLYEVTPESYKYWIKMEVGGLNVLKIFFDPELSVTRPIQAYLIGNRAAYFMANPQIKAAYRKDNGWIYMAEYSIDRLPPSDDTNVASSLVTDGTPELIKHIQKTLKTFLSGGEKFLASSFTPEEINILYQLATQSALKTLENLKAFNPEARYLEQATILADRYVVSELYAGSIERWNLENTPALKPLATIPFPSPEHLDEAYKDQQLAILSACLFSCLPVQREQTIGKEIRRANDRRHRDSDGGTTSDDDIIATDFFTEDRRILTFSAAFQGKYRLESDQDEATNFTHQVNQEVERENQQTIIKIKQIITRESVKYSDFSIHLKKLGLPYLKNYLQNNPDGQALRSQMEVYLGRVIDIKCRRIDGFDQLIIIDKEKKDFIDLIVIEELHQELDLSLSPEYQLKITGSIQRMRTLKWLERNYARPLQDFVNLKFRRYYNFLINAMPGQDCDHGAIIRHIYAQMALESQSPNLYYRANMELVRLFENYCSYITREYSAPDSHSGRRQIEALAAIIEVMREQRLNTATPSFEIMTDAIIKHAPKSRVRTFLTQLGVDKHVMIGALLRSFSADQPDAVLNALATFDATQLAADFTRKDGESNLILARRKFQQILQKSTGYLQTQKDLDPGQRKLAGVANIAYFASFALRSGAIDQSMVEPFIDALKATLSGKALQDNLDIIKSRKQKNFASRDHLSSTEKTDQQGKIFRAITREAAQEIVSISAAIVSNNAVCLQKIGDNESRDKKLKEIYLAQKIGRFFQRKPLEITSEDTEFIDRHQRYFIEIFQYANKHKLGGHLLGLMSHNGLYEKNSFVRSLCHDVVKFKYRQAGNFFVSHSESLLVRQKLWQDCAKPLIDNLRQIGFVKNGLFSFTEINQPYWTELESYIPGVMKFLEKLSKEYQEIMYELSIRELEKQTQDVTVGLSSPILI